MSTGRDYKPTARARRARKGDRGARVPGWLWLLTGAAIGSFAMFLYELHQGRSSQPPAPPAVSASLPGAAPAGAETPAPSAAEQPPDFDFYTLLPQKQVTIPEEELRPQTELTGAKPGSWLLQAGSFRAHQDADRLKATLAFQGLESTIDSVSGSSGTWYRVRLGPFASRREVERIRSRLARENIDALLLGAEP